LPSRRRVGRIAALFAGLTSKEAERALRALRFSNADVAWISSLLDRAGRLAPALEGALLRGETPSDAELRRWVGTAGRVRVSAVLRLAIARAAAAAEGGAVPEWSRSRVHSLYRRALRVAFRSEWPLELADLAVDGDDLRAAGIAPGPRTGRILARLLDEVIEEPSRGARERLLARARELYRELGGEGT
jgi:hypothetical protein